MACPLRKGGYTAEAGVCYAEHGHLGGYIWTGLDKTRAGEKISGRIRVHSFDELLSAIRNQPRGALWRHKQAGDLASCDRETIDREHLRRITDANRGRRGFTYTHFDVVANSENREAIREANEAGFAINLSADTLEEADDLAEMECGPVTVIVPTAQVQNTVTPAGRKVVICPARIRTNITCHNCGLCARQRSVIIAFPTLRPAKVRRAARRLPGTMLSIVLGWLRRCVARRKVPSH
jgi:hypothetical protein